MSPSKDDIQAVHGVFNRQPRMRQLDANLTSIDVLMHLSDGGPDWYYLHTGELSSAVKEAARRCGDIATSQRAMADEIKQLSIPSDDRQNLVAALNAHAASWDARGAAWADEGKPNVAAVVDQIRGHLRDALDAAKQVRPYLPSDG